MNTLFAFEWYGQEAQWIALPTSVFTGPYAAERYPVNLKQQLAEFKQIGARLFDATTALQTAARQLVTASASPLYYGLQSWNRIIPQE